MVRLVGTAAAGREPAACLVLRKVKKFCFVLLVTQVKGFLKRRIYPKKSFEKGAPGTRRTYDRWVGLQLSHFVLCV